MPCKARILTIFKHFVSGELCKLKPHKLRTKFIWGFPVQCSLRSLCLPILWQLWSSVEFVHKLMKRKWSIDPKMPDQDNSKTAHVYPSRNASLSKNPQNVKVSQIIQSVITTQCIPIELNSEFLGILGRYGFSVGLDQMQTLSG